MAVCLLSGQVVKTFKNVHSLFIRETFKKLHTDLKKLTRYLQQLKVPAVKVGRTMLKFHAYADNSRIYYIRAGHYNLHSFDRNF